MKKYLPIVLTLLTSTMLVTSQPSTPGTPSAEAALKTGSNIDVAGFQTKLNLPANTVSELNAITDLVPDIQPAEGQILIGDEAGAYQPKDVSGDIIIDKDGNASLTDPALIIDPEVNNVLMMWDNTNNRLIKAAADFGFFTITNDIATLDTNSVDSDAYVDGSIDPEHLAANSRFRSIAVADLSDATTPSVLVTEETINKLISNHKSSAADHVFTMPAAHAAGNVTFVIGSAFQVDIQPNTGDLFYLNGVAMAANEKIINSTDTIGDTIVGVAVNVNGTYRWMFKSNTTRWAEETP